MGDANNLITLVSCTHFKWTAQVQYKRSFRDRDEAIRYASRRGWNLIVQYKRRSGPLFDVMNDPHLNATFSADGELAETVSADPEPESADWVKLVLQSVRGLVKRLGGAPGASGG